VRCAHLFIYRTPLLYTRYNCLPFHHQISSYSPSTYISLRCNKRDTFVCHSITKFHHIVRYSIVSLHRYGLRSLLPTSGQSPITPAGCIRSRTWGRHAQPLICLSHPFRRRWLMAQHDVSERFTHTPLFREYAWLSDAFITGTWVQTAAAFDLRDYGEFLLKLDHQVPPFSSTEYFDAEWRALLGLPNIHALDRTQVATNSKAMSICWTTLLRYQVLDVLLAMRSGTSDMPCLVRPMPTGTQQVEVSVHLIQPPVGYS
jgi:hypothetical protein